MKKTRISTALCLILALIWNTTIPVSVFAEGENIPIESITVIAEGDLTNILAGEALQLTAAVLPENATNKTVTWSSGDESIATVNESGLVSAISAGLTTITATAQDGSGVFDEFAITVDWFAGDGTEGSPYLITNKIQLDNVRNDLSAYYRIENDIVFTEADFAEGGDFYNAGAGWEPIGIDSTDPFTGTFDGNEHTISGLYCNISSITTVYAGLFGYNRGDIKNVGIINDNISATTTSGAAYAGGIVGYSKEGNISNSYNTGSVNADGSSYDYAGGIAGNNYNGSFNDCYNTGTVSGNDYAGGIVGYQYGGTISECENMGDVVGGIQCDAGGITGYAYYGTIVSGCYNYGDIFGRIAGGISGVYFVYCGDYQKSGYYNNCHNFGTIVANYTTEEEGDRDFRAAGIVGNCGFSITENTYITDCSNTGIISAEIEATVFSISVHAYGIADGGIITNSYNEGNITASVQSSAYSTYRSAHTMASGIGGDEISHCYNIGVIEAYTISNDYHTNNYAYFSSNAAGISVSPSEIYGSYNIGSVTANTTKSQAIYINTPSANAGGIVVNGNCEIVENCYNTGDINAEAANGSGGGIAAIAAMELNNCYNMGQVEGSVYSGGIAGIVEEEGAFNNCYYLDNNSNGVGEGEDTTVKVQINQLREQGTFEGFDFNLIWTMDGNETYAYPELQSIPMVGTYVTSITITSSSDTVMRTNAIQMSANVLPTEADDTSVTWSTTNGTGEATVDADGLLTGTSCGTVTVKATANDGSYVFGEKAITVMPFDGEGTEASPYIITNIEQLNEVRNYLSACFRMENDIVFSEADFAEGGDFYNAGAGWEPIGPDSTNAFTGTFDGNGHSVIGLYCAISNIEPINAGFFGYNFGTIMNVKLIDGSINGGTNEINTSVSAGGIVARNFGIISNCSNESSVNGISQSYSNAGGIAGSNSGGTINNCYNTGNVTSSYMAGGITAANCDNGIIIDCYTTGGVSTTATSSASSYSYASGIAGMNNDSIISYCYNTGNVSVSTLASPATSPLYTYASGIAGQNWNGSIIACYNIGSVSASGSSSTYAYAGGFSGKNIGTNSTISNCYNIGIVSASAGYGAYAGGIAASSSSSINDCYNIGIVNTSSIFSHIYAGGIAASSSSSINDCYYLNIISQGVSIGDDTTRTLTTEQIVLQESFTGFDFDTIWTMDGNGTYALPELQELNMIGKYVTSIIVTSSSSTIERTGTLQMSATVLPADADDASVTWSVENGTGTATIDQTGLLTGTSCGTVTVKATANDGSLVYGTKEITITPLLVSSITVTSDSDTVVHAETLQMSAEVLPEDADDASVTWSVENGTGTATIDQTGLLTERLAEPLPSKRQRTTAALCTAQKRSQ